MDAWRSATAREAVSLHAPSEQIEAVLPEERLAVEDHQRDAPVPGAFLRGFIFGDHGFIAIRLAIDFRIELREVQPCTIRCPGQMIAEMPISHAAKDDAAHCGKERQSFAGIGGGDT